MSSPQKTQQVIPFDSARYLNDDGAIAEYMSAALETGDECLLLLALADVARTQRDH
jgi:DNA-binding phage protein